MMKSISSMLLVLLLVSLNTSPLKAESPIQLTFGADEIGKFPSGWMSLDGQNIPKVYSIQAEGGKKFIHAESKGSGVQIGYEKKWVLKEFPILQWVWRAVLFPQGTNEREKSGNDSVLGLYVIFGHWPMLKAIKYIWSDTHPVGAIFTSPFYKDTKIMVVRSGRSQAGTWLTERRDVLADFYLLFGDGEKNPTAKGIAILTDSDNTKTQAVGDYAGFHTLTSNGGKTPQP